MKILASTKLKWFFWVFFFLLYNIVLVVPYINMNPRQVYTCSPSWTPLPPPSPYHPSGSSQCTRPKHPVSCIEPGLVTRFIHYIIHFIFIFITYYYFAKMDPIFKANFIYIFIFDTFYDFVFSLKLYFWESNLYFRFLIFAFWYLLSILYL